MYEATEEKTSALSEEWTLQIQYKDSRFIMVHN